MSNRVNFPGLNSIRFLAAILVIYRQVEQLEKRVLGWAATRAVLLVGSLASLLQIAGVAGTGRAWLGL